MSRASWDEGWSGRYVHRYSFDDARNKETMSVSDSVEDRPFLYVEMDGEKFCIYRKERAGFRR